MKALLSAVLLGLLFAVPLRSDEEEAKAPPKLDADLLAGIKLRNIGPALMSGRIADLAVDPVKPNTWYVAVGSGNLWKTVNAGTTWTPIFENYGSYSIGCVTIDPSNRNTVWVGTGENVSGRHVGYGDGVYRSRDGGKTFTNLGLAETEHISKILVDPRDSSVVYVAAQGPLWTPGGERGLFRSTDGGKRWDNMLEKGAYTGVTDIAFDPRNPDVLYAATHQRHRTVWALINGGPESGIFKSTDRGETWRELKNGLPGGDKGKIGLAVSPIKPDVVYATIELTGRKGGFWRSDNGGESWSKMSDYVSGGTGPHYYQEIYCDPHRFDVLYQANVRLGRTEDGGRTWESVEGRWKHVDNHAVVFHPTDPDFLLVGCDGGLYRSFDYAATFEFFANLPLTQFYKVDVDYDYPIYHVVGGTQDNATQYGPARTANRSGIRNSDWKVLIGGDGHDCAIDPEDPDIIYCESQQGYLRRYDRRTGESVSIRPRPEKGEPDLRFNWDSPIIVSPHAHTRLYFGSQKLHRSDDRGDSWTVISPDLSRGRNRYELEVMERVHSVDGFYDLTAMSQYGNITCVSESPLEEGLIYVGTDDGLIQVTEDGGRNWRRIDRVYGVPEFAFVNDVKADRHDADVVYAALDNHKFGDLQPYLLRSDDRGRTWTSIAGDLPDRHIVWRFIQDHERHDLFFVGTEFGVFASLDGGEAWLKLKGGTPNIPFRDLEIQRRENDLVGASFGRSFWVLDDYSFMRELSDDLLKEEAFVLFPVKPALLYVPARPLGGEKGSQGDSFFTAANPAFGASFTYYLRDEVKTKKQQRMKEEAKQAKAGDDARIPDWDELKREEREDSPRLVFTIRNEAGEVVNRLRGATSPGLHRITWDLRRESVSSVSGDGPLALPGTYRVSAARHADDGSVELGAGREFEVLLVAENSLPRPARESVLAFQSEVEELRRAVRGTSRKVEETLGQIREAKAAVANRLGLEADLHARTRTLELKLMDLQERLAGDPIRPRYSVQRVPSINSRLSVAAQSFSTTYGPTQTQRRDYEIAFEEYAEVKADVRAGVEVEVVELYQELEAAKVPWTTGRPLPRLED